MKCLWLWVSAEGRLCKCGVNENECIWGWIGDVGGCAGYLELGIREGEMEEAMMAD
jgi:hypothetical protein